MKVVFLDIDGVLNSQDYYTKRHEQRQSGMRERDFPLDEFDPQAIQLLNNICNATGAKVVVSSTWRHGRSIKQLQTLLESVGFKGKVVSKTPDLCRQSKGGLWVATERGEEIKAWLDKKECKAFVILDDDKDMLTEQQNNFVHTSWMSGLTDECAARAIEILQG